MCESYEQGFGSGSVVFGQIQIRFSFSVDPDPSQKIVRKYFDIYKKTIMTDEK